LHDMAAHVAQFPLTLWAVFFLIQTGRGASLDQISADECEEVMEWLADLSTRSPFGIKTTEAPHYRRVLAEHGDAPLAPAFGRGLRATRAVNDGNGFVFIDHTGAICPSGFLPMPRGNVRTHSLREVYCADDVFRRLRDPNALEGACGGCEFREVCGGSRSRAYAQTGNAFASDPLCVIAARAAAVAS
jgi:radical SAM protein with 4Fe4S-binding SPASM domain